MTINSASGDSSAAIGIACLAEALAGTGGLERGRALLSNYPMPAALEPAGLVLQGPRRSVART